MPDRTWPLPRYLSASRDGVSWSRQGAAVFLVRHGLIRVDFDGRDLSHTPSPTQEDVQRALVWLYAPLHGCCEDPECGTRHVDAFWWSSPPRAVLCAFCKRNEGRL